MSAVPSYPRDRLAGIPGDLLMLIFDFLAQPDLLHVAHVSPRWRAAARSHPRFYRYISLDCDCGRDREEAALQLAAWVGIVDECLELATPVGIRIAVSEHGTHGVHATDAATVRDVLLHRIHRLLAQTVYLDLRMQGLHAHALLEALTSPAPRLSWIRIHLTGKLISPFGSPSSALFGGYAPNLRELELSNVPLDHAQKHRAFSAVRALSMSPCSYGLLSSLRDTFPSVSTLNIHVMKYKVPTSLRHSNALRCSLRSITLRTKTHLPRPIVELMDVAPGMNVDVEFMQESIDWELDIAPLIAGLPDPLDLCIIRDNYFLWAVHIRSAHRTRIIRAPTMSNVFRSPFAQTPLLLIGILPLLHRVTALEVDGFALPQVAACLRAELPQLRTLTLSWVPSSSSGAVIQWHDFLDWISENAVGGPMRCTALESLTLIWRGVPLATLHGGPAPPVIRPTALVDLFKALDSMALNELRLCGIVSPGAVAGH